MLLFAALLAASFASAHRRDVTAASKRISRVRTASTDVFTTVEPLPEQPARRRRQSPHRLSVSPHRSPASGTWLGGGITSERGADSAEVHTRAIADSHRRV